MWITVLQNNTASVTFLHKSGAVRSVAWILSLGLRLGRNWANTFQWTNVSQSSFQTVSISSPSFFQNFFLIAFLEKA